MRQIVLMQEVWKRQFGYWMRQVQPYCLNTLCSLWIFVFFVTFPYSIKYWPQSSPRITKDTKPWRPHTRRASVAGCTGSYYSRSEWHNRRW